MQCSTFTCWQQLCPVPRAAVGMGAQRWRLSTAGSALQPPICYWICGLVRAGLSPSWTSTGLENSANGSVVSFICSAVVTLVCISLEKTKQINPAKTHVSSHPFIYGSVQLQVIPSLLSPADPPRILNLISQPLRAI